MLEIVRRKINDEQITLPDMDEWIDCTYDDIFDIQKGARLTKADAKPGKTPYVSSSEFNNAVTAYVDQEANYEGNQIVIHYNGSVGESFYQPFPFYASDSECVLSLRGATLNKYVAFFLITIIKKEKYRFSFGRSWKLSRMKKSKIKLPAKDGKPDWILMENYIKSLPFSASI